MSDDNKPDPMVVDGDSKTVLQGNKKHPWNQVNLPKQPDPPPTYKYELTVQHKDDEKLEIKAVCKELEELITFHRQFAGIDYLFVKMERVQA